MSYTFVYFGRIKTKFLLTFKAAGITSLNRGLVSLIRTKSPYKPKE